MVLLPVANDDDNQSLIANFIEHLVGASLCTRHFTDISLLSRAHIFYRWGNWVREVRYLSQDSNSGYQSPRSWLISQLFPKDATKTSSTSKGNTQLLAPPTCHGGQLCTSARAVSTAWQFLLILQGRVKRAFFSEALSDSPSPLNPSGMYDQFPLCFAWNRALLCCCIYCRCNCFWSVSPQSTGLFWTTWGQKLISSYMQTAIIDLVSTLMC